MSYLNLKMMQRQVGPAGAAARPARCHGLPARRGGASEAPRNVRGVDRGLFSLGSSVMEEEEPPAGRRGPRDGSKMMK